MQKLTIPKSKQITTIIHISDVHIRVGDLERSRYDDDDDDVSVFDNFERLITRLPQVKNNTAITIFTGDFFHYKNKLDSLSVKLFNILIEKITNHDFLLWLKK